MLEGLPGTSDVEFEAAEPTHGIVVELDRAELAPRGLGTGEVNKAIADAVAGAKVGFIPEGEARHAVVIRMPESLRADPAAILALPLWSAGTVWCRCRPSST